MFYATKTDYKGTKIRIVVSSHDGSVMLQFGGEKAAQPSVIMSLHPEDAEEFARDILAVIESLRERVTIQ